MTKHIEKILRWLCYALILVVVYDVLMRYTFSAPPIWGYDTAVMIGGSIYVLAWSYTHVYNGHVRVDAIYSHLGLRTRAIIDAISNLLLVIFLAFVIKVAFSWMWRAWVNKEIFQVTIWYPPSAPFRTIVLIGICLFAFQGIAHVIRCSYIIVRNKPYD